MSVVNESDVQLYLASGSPRRRELLEQIGIRYRVVSAPVDESIQQGELAYDYVRRLALAKALAGAAAADGNCPVLGADTAVVLDDRILAKPEHREDGLRMLASLSGRTHTVLTAIALVGEGAQAVRLSLSRVAFRPISRQEIENYWATGEPADKAGGYAIQGKAAAFIERIEGSYSGVMGLPLFETAELLQTVGINSV